MKSLFDKLVAKIDDEITEAENLAEARMRTFVESSKFFNAKEIYPCNRPLIMDKNDLEIVSALCTKIAALKQIKFYALEIENESKK